MALPNPALVGNLTADPELRFAPSGMAVATFTVACSSRKQNAAGEWEDDKTLFMPVTAFRDLAEHVAESLAKGDGVIVTGRVYTDQWTSPEGDKRSMVKMNAEEVGVSLKFRIVPHGAGKTQRSAAPAASDPWATTSGTTEQGAQAPASPAYDEPPF